MNDATNKAMEPYSSFISKALDHTPSFVVGFVGAFLGIAIAIVTVLKLGGLDVPFNRIVNAYAASIEASLTKIEKSTDIVPLINDKLGVIQTSVESLNKRMDRIDSIDVEQNRKIIEHEGRITTTEVQLRRLGGLK